MSEPLLPPSQPEQLPAPVVPWPSTRPEPAISTTARVPGPLTLADLSATVRAVEPAALLVPPRLLRRIIHEDRAGLHLGLQIPHRKSHIIGRAALLDIIDLDELPLEPGQQLAETVILLAAPDPDDLAVQDPGIALTQCWRLLFHAVIHVALERRFAELPLTAAELEQRWARLGASEFDEIRTVLEHEKYLPRASDARSAYVEFVAVFLELRFFDPALLACYFPGLTDLDRIERQVAEDIDAPDLLARTRLPGAVPLAVAEPAADDLEDWPEEEAWSGALDRPGWLGRLVQRVANLFEGGGIAANLRYRRFIRQAKKAARRGNTVRAAILRTAAAGVADSAEQATVARTAARADLDHLA